MNYQRETMPFQKQRLALNLSGDEKAKLESVSATSISLKEKKRAEILLYYYDQNSINSIAIHCRVSRPLVERLVDRAIVEGIDEALKDKPRAGHPKKK